MRNPEQPSPSAERYAALRKAHTDGVRRALQRHKAQIAVSHESAAIVHGVATYDIPAKAYLTRTDGSRRDGRRAKVALAELRRDDIEEVRMVTRWNWAQAHASDEIFRARLLAALKRAA